MASTTSKTPRSTSSSSCLFTFKSLPLLLLPSLAPSNAARRYRGRRRLSRAREVEHFLLLVILLSLSAYPQPPEYLFNSAILCVALELFPGFIIALTRSHLRATQQRRGLSGLSDPCAISAKFAEGAAPKWAALKLIAGAV
eukprot:TRINITY_DN56409_c0_g1_i1.p1 TRINITY_DN56409_c0_g1~~TRINITY_DN56409_c0_g1_i1.p1  ORF type:complete len:141 (+),score=9.28 TRINITY_DN56409_c0_g1_i1:59-481(+)